MKPFTFAPQPLRLALSRRHVVPLLLAGVGLLTVTPVQAVMLDLGLVTNTGSSANAVSGDGSVVVGYRDGYFLLWSAATGNSTPAGLVPVGSRYDDLQFTSASRDGSVIAGLYLNSSTGRRQAFRWSAASGLQNLGAFSASGSSQAFGISSDGSTVVGVADDGFYANAFRWTAAGGMQNLGGLYAGRYSEARAVSGDGAVVAGAARDMSYNRHAFRWENGVMEDLGTLAGGYDSFAQAISRDGAVIAGYSNTASSGTRAFRWTRAAGMTDLGTLGGNSYAYGVNADGSAVVGVSGVNGFGHAFRWTVATGMADLGTLSNDTDSQANGISDDGSVVVGDSWGGSAGKRAFIWRGSPVSAPVQTVGILQDLSNLQTSVLASANTSAQLINSQGQRLRELSQANCIPGAAQQYCLSLGAGGVFGAADESDSTQSLAQFAGGMRLSEHFSVGANGQLAQADLKTNSAAQKQDYGLSLWLAYQQNPELGTGWNASLATAAGTGISRFKRGNDLLDVQKASSDVRITSTAQRAAVGYGVMVDKTLLTPELAVTHVHSQREAFEEHNVAFPLRVEGASSDETYASLALHSATPLSARTTLHLSLAADVLLDERADDFAGTSQIPGLSEFQVRSSLVKRDVQPMAAARLSYALSPAASVSAGVQVAASAYEQQRPVTAVGVQFSYGF